MKIFDLDSPLMNVLNKMADLMWLNILTLICCIPVITAGAALTSMHYVALKIVRNEESYITRSFFKSFKTNFRQATLIWLLLMLVAAILGGDYYIITKSGMQFSQVLVVLIMAAGVLVICTSLYVFPVLAKFDNTIMGTIRNAFIMSILQLPKTVVMFVMAFFPLIIYLVSLRLIPIIFLFGFHCRLMPLPCCTINSSRSWKISCCQNRSLHRKSRRKRMREYSMMNWMKA